MGTTIASPKSGSGWRECLKRLGDRLEYKNKEEWMKEMKGSLSLTASIIATMTFQLATNPPGGVVQASLGDDLCHLNRTSTAVCDAGKAVSAIINEGTYLAFLVCNTISFIASLGVCLLLVSGIPLEHQFAIWLLSVGMCVTVTSLALTYLFAASMVTPDSIWSSVVGNGFGIVMVVWASLAVIVGTFHIVRFFVRRVIKWIL